MRDREIKIGEERLRIGEKVGEGKKKEGEVRRRKREREREREYD